MLLNLPLQDPMSGYFVFKRSLFDQCRDRLRPRGYKILVELCFKGRPGRVKEIPFIFRNRHEGYSKLSGFVVHEYFMMLMLLLTDSWMQKVRFRYHTGRYAKVNRWLKYGSVLDIGCGRPCETMPDGSFLKFIGRGTGVDLKPIPKADFPFVQGSVLDLPFEDGSFDNVVAMEVLEHVTDPHRAFQEIRRVLKSDGRLVISVPSETWLWEKIWHLWERTYGYMWNETHTGTMPPPEWMRILSKYFDLEERRLHWRFDLIMNLHRREGSLPTDTRKAQIPVISEKALS